MSTCIVHERPPAPEPALVERFRGLPAAVVTDQRDRLGGLDGLRPLDPPSTPVRLAGPAVTVKVRPGDNLVLHRACDLLRAGEVLVVDGGGATDRALIGEILYTHAVANGAVGFVIDGAVRDVSELVGRSAPVFARAVTPVGPYKDGPGELYGPVVVGGSVVRTGDVVVGDADGAVVVPWERAEEVATGSEAQVEDERRKLQQITDGTLDRSWVEAALNVRAAGPAG